MTPTYPFAHRAARELIRWLVLLALPATLAVGCGDDDNGAPMAAVTPTPIVNADAGAACQKLEGCGQCFINQTGQCIGTTACADRLGSDVAICINGIGSCNANSLGDCLFLGCDGNDATGECAG